MQILPYNILLINKLSEKYNQRLDLDKMALSSKFGKVAWSIFWRRLTFYTTVFCGMLKIVLR